MQTVYLLKDCASSYKALKTLYSSPDLSTNIIIVDNEQAQILLLDKRVKKFPFIINSLPTQIGLIPKSSQVMPLSVFMMLKDFHENEMKLSPVKKQIPVSRHIRQPVDIPRHIRQPVDIPRHIRQRPNKEFYKKRPRKQGMIHPGHVMTKRSADGGVNIFLK